MQVVSSEKMLNINFSYGLFCNVQRTLQSILRLEREEAIKIKQGYPMFFELVQGSEINSEVVLEEA
jgi:hypothetical protein